MSDLRADGVPELVDAWRMVAARRGFEGHVPLAALTRLRDSLDEAEGEVRFALDFGTDALQVPFVDLDIEADLPLQCQRSLRRFLLPVQIRQRLGLIRRESDEAALPADCEPLLVPADGMLRLLDLVEDELILALPVVPVAPDSEVIERDFAPGPEENAAHGAFSALAEWKKP
ncbi:MAG: YceD family protein [Thermomonas sp.]|uniref:YceD family protein n=1 Tax=Thermomonas sp. TaxID=1971895 RepID=UPI001D6875DD|nr:YceD family protein [Thermomonas sp.]MBZ0086945.1 YceD family protein [Thermomonas sp.]